MRVVRTSGQRADLDAAVARATLPLLRHGPSVQRPPTVDAVERYDLAIIGLGGIGSATAWFAARDGHSVIGLERFELGGHHHGASHDHSRIIRHSYHTPHYVGLTRLAYDAWREVEAESGETCVHITGGIDLFPSGAAIDIETYRDSMTACEVDFDELTASRGDDALAGMARRGRHRGAVSGQHRHRLAGGDGAAAAATRRRSRSGAARQHDGRRRSNRIGDDVIVRLAGGDAVRRARTWWWRPTRGQHRCSIRWASRCRWS